MHKNSLCRLCLSEYNVNVPIFGHDNNTSGDVLAKIFRFTPIKISANDSLPKYICNSCLTLLELFHQFSVTTTNSEIKLLQAISNAAATKSAETPSTIGRVFSFTETLRSPKVREEDTTESIYSPTEEVATRIQLYKPPSENDSYENIFYTFRNCFSVDGINTVNNNYVTQKNSPNILLPQLQFTVSKTEIELNYEDIDHVNELPKTEDIDDFHKVEDIPNLVDHNATISRPFNTIDEYLECDMESLNSDIFHSGVGSYIPDLDRDVQVTLVDEHRLPLSLVMKKHAPLRWLVDHYCKLSGNAPNQIGFQYNGHLIKETATACELGLCHGDVMHVVLLWQQPHVIIAQKIRY